MDKPTLREKCVDCEGRGFTLPHLTQTASGEDPPRTVWCTNCDRRGYVLTRFAYEVIELIRDHGDEVRGFLPNYSDQAR